MKELNNLNTVVFAPHTNIKSCARIFHSEGFISVLSRIKGSRGRFKTVSLLKIEFSSESKSLSFYNNVDGSRLGNGQIEWTRLAHGSQIEPMRTDNEENTFTLRPINCFNSICHIEFKINGKRITNSEVPEISKIRIKSEHLRATFMIKARIFNIIYVYSINNNSDKSVIIEV